MDAGRVKLRIEVSLFFPTEIEDQVAMGGSGVVFMEMLQDLGSRVAKEREGEGGGRSRKCNN